MKRLYLVFVISLVTLLGMSIYVSSIARQQSLTKQKYQQIEKIPSGGVFVEYESPPEIPPQAMVTNYRTGKATLGVEVAYEWIIDRELKIHSLPDNQIFNRLTPAQTSQVSDLKWNLGTQVVPKLVELYIVDLQGFDLDVPIETLHHMASCQIKGNSLNGKLPECVSIRDVNGNWEVATPTILKTDKPLYALLSAWWHYYPKAPSNTGVSGEEESSILWVIWLFKIAGKS